MLPGHLKRHRYFILLVILVVDLLAQTTTSDDQLPRELLITMATVAVFFVVFERPRHRAFAFWAGAAAITASWAQNIVPIQARPPIELAHNGLMITIFALAVGVILRHLFEPKESISADDVLGTICGFLLLAGIWANLYAATDLLFPNSFQVLPVMQASLADWDGRHALFNYFSLVTLTTVGYGDITPTRGPATAFAALEAVAGQFYLAIVVAQLVGVKLSQGARSDRDR